MKNKYTKSFFVESGRKGGEHKSEKKAAAARANGLLGGRPWKWKSPENLKKRADRMASAMKKGTHTAAEWNALVLFCGGKCVLCRVEGKVARDHIKPIYQGGSHSIKNIQPLCRSCNSAKGSCSKDHRPKGWAAAVKKIVENKS